MTEAEAKEILEHYISPSGVGFPDVKEAIAVLLKKLLEQEPKTGQWVLTDDDFVYCSECKDSYYPRPIDASWYYCPHCGAKMQAESEVSNADSN